MKFESNDLQKPYVARSYSIGQLSKQSLGLSLTNSLEKVTHRLIANPVPIFLPVSTLLLPYQS